MWGKAQWEARSKGGVGIKVAHRWCPQEKRVCWGVGDEGGESNEASGEFGQESGERGHRSMLCKSIAV